MTQLTRNYYTPNAWEGSKYAQTQHLDIKDIAKLVRADIKNQYPGIKTSVRIERYAGGRSLNIKVTESDTPLKNPLYDADFAWKVRVGKITSWNSEDSIKLDQMTPDGEDVQQGLHDIVNAYRYDDSDSMIDYFATNFHTSIIIDC